MQHTTCNKNKASYCGKRRVDAGGGKTDNNKIGIFIYETSFLYIILF
jgi:hypothetical protein